MKATGNRIKAISKAIRKQAPPDEIKVTLSCRTDGLVEWGLPNGETELITEAEYKARGGILVRLAAEEIPRGR